jgi:transposase
MVRPNMTKWDQTLSDLRRLSVDAKHPRTRERFLALYMIGSQQKNATQWAAEIGRMDDTVLDWVHRYNNEGPEGLTYQRTGGRPPFFRRNKSKQLSRR